MRNAILLTVLLSVAAAAGAAASSYYDDPKDANAKAPAPAGLLSVLKAGQTVSLAERGGSYELTISTTKILSRYKVARVAGDYVVLSSEPKLLEIRIPVTSIRAIIHMKR